MCDHNHRASYPDMGGSWVKQVELDEAMQVSVCCSFWSWKPAENVKFKYIMKSVQSWRIIQDPIIWSLLRIHALKFVTDSRSEIHLFSKSAPNLLILNHLKMEPYFCFLTHIFLTASLLSVWTECSGLRHGRKSSISDTGVSDVHVNLCQWFFSSFQFTLETTLCEA